MTDVVEVRVGAERRPISPDLWGIFLEDINFALDGGLDAEMVVNGDFEFSTRDRRGWGPLTGWRVAGPVGQRPTRVRDERPLHPSTPNHLRVTGPAVVRNEGYDGHRVVDGGRYRLRLAARLLEGSDPLSAHVSEPAGELTDRVVLDRAGTGWTWLEGDLTAVRTGAGQLTLEVPAGIVVEIDAVSLRPLDDDGEPRLFRPDLLGVLAELRPAFVRFPGGCVAHGLGLANIYSWKDTVGPRHERRRQPNLWGYHQSMSIGYLEYFLLCETLGATAVPVIAAGVCCQNTPGGQRALSEEAMVGYVQDALDLVEFADGGPDTPWGAVRARLGHPEPFGLRYLGVGNEDEITPEFRDRYARIEDALRAAHPELTVIGTSGPAPFGATFDSGWAFARERGTAMVDEHFYRTPQWFHQNVDRYDGYDRRGPAVYLGEYAARTNRWRSALAEAAFMIGIERNGDLVRLASYAPLLARTGETQWEPDLVYFDADTVHPSASYHVQRLFGRAAADAAHPVELTGAPGRPLPRAPRSALTVRCPGATFRLSDVVVDGVPAPDAAVTGAEGHALADVDPAHLDLELVATRTQGAEGLLVDLGETDDEAPLLTLVLGGWQNKSSGMMRRYLGITENDCDLLPWEGVSTGRPLHLRVRVRPELVQVWVDGALHHEYAPDRSPEQRVVAGATSRATADGVEHVVKLVNADEHARSAVVDLAGLRVRDAAATVLAGAGPDEGAPGEDSPVRPREAVLAPDHDGRLPVELSPWSFTVIRVRSEPHA